MVRIALLWTMVLWMENAKVYCNRKLQIMIALLISRSKTNIATLQMKSWEFDFQSEIHFCIERNADFCISFTIKKNLHGNRSSHHWLKRADDNCKGFLRLILYLACFLIATFAKIIVLFCILIPMMDSF